MSAVKKPRGFTLVEMLVALAVLSLISLAAVTALRSFAQSQSAVERKIEQVEQMRMTLGFVRTSIAKAVAVEEARAFNLLFKGQENELVWVAPRNAGLHKGLVIHRLAANAEGGLSIQFLPYMQSSEKLEWAVEPAHLLVGGEVELELGYRKNWQEDWETEWERRQSLPQNLRLNIKVNDRYWPELVVRLNSAGLGTL